VQHRWDTHSLADLCESGTTKDLGGFWREKSCLAARNSVTSCGEYDYIMLDQFLNNGDMPRIQRGPGVVSPNHAGYTSYAAVDDVVIEGHVGTPEGPA
jgi:hypothetical protein